MQKIIRFTVIVLATVGVLSGMAGPGHAQFSLYDNFITGTINPELWEGVSVEGNFGQPTAELIRTAEGGTLELKLVSWGNNTSNAGNIQSRQGVAFKDLGTLGGTGSIIGIKAKVTIADALVQDCAANPDTGGSIRARAQVLGWFFNTGASTGPTDDTGNAIVGFQLTKEADGSNQIQTFFQTCSNSTCSIVATPAGITPPVFVTTWSPNTPIVLKMRVVRSQGKVKYLVRDPLTLASETVVLDYGIVPDAGPAVNGDFKQIRVQNNVKNCQGDRKQVMMDALFDNVNVQRAP